ncbi:hypothetical protein GF343_04920 [Candidatus Woesearchaeota archaeon]|nr:hypothetical protein [Candidatus Woesearchaeota archaeon]
MAKYGLLVNPAAGRKSTAEKKKITSHAAKILGNCTTAGLETKSAKEFRACAAKLAKKVDVLIVAGGDGSFYEAVNSIDSDVALAYLPLGTGNALKYALGLHGSELNIIKQIKNGKEHRHDLISYKNRKAVFASIGLDGEILQKKSYGLCSYALRLFEHFVRGFSRTSAEICIDDEKITMQDTISLIVTKIPYYGFGLKVVPKASLNDGKLHFLAVNDNFSFWCGLTASLFWKNTLGKYCSGKNIHIKTKNPCHAHLNGIPLQEKSTEFRFTIKENAIRMVY